MELVRIVCFDKEYLALCKKPLIVFSRDLVPSDNRCKHVILLEDLKKAKIPYFHALFMLSCFLQSSLMTVSVKYKHGFVLNSILKSTSRLLS